MKALLQAHALRIQQGARILCQPFDLTIYPGSVWGLLGPNGVGKTTLLHSLAGLLPHSTGSIVLNGANIHALNRKTIAQQIGVLFQIEQLLFPQTVHEFCHSYRYPHLTAWGYEAKDPAPMIEHALQLLDLSDYRTRLVQTLSGGERQRLSIAALLCQDPQLFLLDEPLNHLDLHYQVRILKQLRDLTRVLQKSVLMTSHDIHIVMHYCDFVILFFPDGTLLSGPPHELLNAERLYKLYQQEFTFSATHHTWLPVFK